ncbi:MAG TPA: hypothetical protein VGQ83_37300 [Polyangia bacterium]|jgi:hypothetical protein
MRARPLQIAALLAGVTLVAYFFANVEVQIEGADGWAARLPVTFRIEKHWLLDLFWGGRPMTGYHAWAFSFMAVAFHFPLIAAWRWSWRIEARIVACLALFWVIEDFLWFVLNPAYGVGPLFARQVPWHKKWLLGLPQDYWSFALVAALLLWLSYRGGRRDAQATQFG